MRVPGVVLVLVVALTGCGTSSPSTPGTATPASTTAAGHGDAAAQKALTKALTLFEAAGSGTYESEVTADGVSQALAHETGTFQLTPVAAQLERAILGIDQASAEPRVRVLRVRATAGHRYYLQVKDWANWTGCWLPMHLSALAKQTGVDLVRFGPLPRAIAILARARVLASGAGIDGPHLAVDAYTALQFLGVASAAIKDQREALLEASVPVLLDVTADGGAAGAVVEGSQVADALGAAGLTLPDRVSRYVAKAQGRVVLSRLGQPVVVRPPVKAELLPVKARLQNTCPANR